MAIGKLTTLVLMLVLVSGCSSYSSNFACGDSKGASCMSMDRVDAMISSGEIEVYTVRNGKCRGRNCKGEGKSEELTELKADPLTEGEIYFKEHKNREEKR